MKNLITKLTIAATTAMLGIGVVSFMVASNNKTEKASANHLTAVNGTYKKVTDPTNLNSGDKVLIKSNSGYVLRDCGGNPAYLYATNENVAVGVDNSLLFADNAYFQELTVTKTVTQEGTYYAFYGDYNYWNVNFSGYLAYEPRGSREGTGATDYSNISLFQYFKDYTGLRKSLVDASYWSLAYDSGNDLMSVKNKETGGYLGFTNSYDDRFVLGGGDAINLYKKVTLSSVQITVSPNKSASNGYHYKSGEKVDLTGLEIRAAFSNDESLLVTYEDNEKLFSWEEYPHGYGTNVEVGFSFCGISGYFVAIVDQFSQPYVKVTQDYGDYRGSYILSAYVSDLEQWTTLAFKKNSDDEYDVRFVEATVSAQNEISVKTSGNVPLNSTFFDLVRRNGLYYLKKTGNADEEPNPLYLNAYGNGLTTNASNDNALDVSFENGQAYLVKRGTSQYLVNYYGGTDFAFDSSNGYKVNLFRESFSNETYSQVDNYMNTLSNVLSSCVPEGDQLSITSSAWDSLAQSFELLSLPAQSIIAGTRYTHGAEKYNSRQDLIDRYDYVISKYQFSDFMSRKNTPCYENHFNADSNGIFPLNTNRLSNDSILVITMSLTMLIALAGLIIIKKRKTN